MNNIILFLIIARSETKTEKLRFQNGKQNWWRLQTCTTRDGGGQGGCGGSG